VNSPKKLPPAMPLQEQFVDDDGVSASPLPPRPYAKQQLTVEQSKVNLLFSILFFVS
jgi:hypothetical protein